MGTIGLNKMLPKPAENADDLAQLFAILGDATRVRILFLIRDSEMPVQDLADTLEMTHSAISHHLRLLRLHHIVRGRKVGRSVFYSLEDKCVWNLLESGESHLRHDTFGENVKK
ncbi:MAG: metalloregulator ArsR/SmtB family transcription factor [Proteobacteria bacterium]|nr:helix-turn-helix transcriptional regulator [Desulfobulbaceae bacterium]MBU4152999.1 metalloregulator ArsR/SmtB family transcription factor [Pseudomonadota bacterium]